MYLINENKCSIIKTFDYSTHTLHINTEKQNIYLTFEDENNAKETFDYILKCLKLTHFINMKHIKEKFPEAKVIIC